MRFTCVVGVLCLASSVAAGAQTLPKEYAQFMSKDYHELMTAVAAAQAKAIRPGDEGMSCAAVEKELVTLIPMAQLKLIMPILPQMMRAQHLVGLALTQSCPSILAPYTGAFPQPLPGLPRR